MDLFVSLGLFLLFAITSPCVSVRMCIDRKKPRKDMEDRGEEMSNGG